MKDIIISSNKMIDSDYYCDGINDEIEFNHAMNLARNLGKSIVITPGKYCFEIKEPKRINSAQMFFEKL